MRLLSMPPGGSRLVRDYLAGAPRPAPFYRGSPFETATYRRKADELDRTTGPGVREVAASIVRPAGPAARQALREVLRREGYFVTTGQQPGLLGGPLYSLYKALTAVRLADDLTMALERPVMPLFWVASEDHDWEEANHAHVIDESNRLRHLTLGSNPGAVPRPLGRIRLGEGIVDVVDRLEGCFPRNDYHARYMDLVRGTYNPWATMASAFSDLMAELLRDTPAGLIDAAHPALKEASRPILRAEAEDPVASEEAVRESCDALTGLGYALQVPVIPGAVNLCTDLGEGRDRLQRSGGGFTRRRSGRAISKRRLMSLIEDVPDKVSPNVLLRPVVESFVFPTLAYVGGPGELAYFGQLSGLFRRHGTGVPVAVPRGSLMAVETKVSRVLAKFELEAGELRRGDALLSRFARERIPADAQRALGRWREAVESVADELEGISAGIDAGLAGSVTRARNTGLSALATLEKKIVRAVKRRSETTAAQIMKAAVNLWPAGKPQERVLAPLQYLMRYGPEFTRSVLREARVELDRGTA